VDQGTQRGHRLGLARGGHRGLADPAAPGALPDRRGLPARAQPRGDAGAPRRGLDPPLHASHAVRGAERCHRPRGPDRHLFATGVPTLGALLQPARSPDRSPITALVFWVPLVIYCGWLLVMPWASTERSSTSRTSSPTASSHVPIDSLASAGPALLEQCDRPARRAHHVPGEAGICVLILGEMTIFAALFAVYTHERTASKNLFTAFKRELDGTIGLIKAVGDGERAAETWPHSRTCREGPDSAPSADQGPLRARHAEPLANPVQVRGPTCSRSEVSSRTRQTPAATTELRSCSASSVMICAASAAIRGTNSATSTNSLIAEAT